MYKFSRKLKTGYFGLSIATGGSVTISASAGQVSSGDIKNIYPVILGSAFGTISAGNVAYIYKDGSDYYIAKSYKDAAEKSPETATASAAPSAYPVYSVRNGGKLVVSATATAQVLYACGKNSPSGIGDFVPVVISSGSSPEDVSLYYVTTSGTTLETGANISIWTE